VVIVDLNHVCYDNHPTPAEADSLWSSFTTPANAGSDRSTLAGVAFDARTRARDRSPPSASIRL